MTINAVSKLNIVVNARTHTKARVVCENQKSAGLSVLSPLLMSAALWTFYSRPCRAPPLRSSGASFHSCLPVRAGWQPVLLGEAGVWLATVCLSPGPFFPTRSTKQTHARPNQHDSLSTHQQDKLLSLVHSLNFPSNAELSNDNMSTERKKYIQTAVLPLFLFCFSSFFRINK